MERLIEVVQELSLARDLERVMAIVRTAARELTGADGATFVLRDGGFCHYVDEDAIEPLWKGQRFPLEACISGWAMLHRAPAIIEDIYLDPRIPAHAYRPTFVKSLVMVPIRTASPVGAIGNYWARKRCATDEEVRLLAALADSTSVAMENIQLYQTLEERVRERTAQLAASQEELARKHEALLRAQRQKEEMAALLVHDLKSPASGIMLSCKARLRRADLTEVDRQNWTRIFAGAEVINRMALNVIDVTRSDEGTFRATLAEFDLQAMLEELVELMTPLAQGREQELALQTDLKGTSLQGDRELLRRVLQNLIDNAFHYNRPQGTVELRAELVEGAVEIRVIDQGP
ncbi:MAG TPA: GAF domain-containing protein, partial [Polyangiaceae bacterium]|nr:GAF domain-containing protein [Polyangiaceae bacterium]